MPIKNFTHLSTYQNQKTNAFITKGSSWKHRTNNIFVYSCEFNKTLYHPELYTEFGIQFPQKLKSSVIKRQAEFLAGRYAAKQAISNFEEANHDEQVFNIPIGKHRNPIWPKNVIGSITHSDNIAYCAVKSSNQNTKVFIGLDVECIFSQETEKQIKNQILTPYEIEHLSAKNISKELLLTIIFSAKESFFKATYPHIQKYFDFYDAQVISFNFDNNHLRLAFSPKFANEIQIFNHFDCYFHENGKKVLTFIFKSLPCPLPFHIY